MSINCAIIMGRLTKDAELKTTNNGINYTRFTVAVDRPKKQGEEKKGILLAALHGVERRNLFVGTFQRVN